MTVIKCDVCGDVVDNEHHFKVNVEVDEPTFNATALVGMSSCKDMCPLCLAKFYQLIGK